MSGGRRRAGIFLRSPPSGAEELPKRAAHRAIGVFAGKRLAWLATRLFYVRNGYDLRAESATKADAMVRKLASGDYDVPVLAKLLFGWTRSL